MSDKKIFIAMSQKEARSVITAIEFTAFTCIRKQNENFIFNHEHAERIGITKDEVYELQDFSERLKQLADEQAKLETSIEQPVTSNQP